MNWGFHLEAVYAKQNKCENMEKNEIGDHFRMDENKF